MVVFQSNFIELFSLGLSHLCSTGQEALSKNCFIVSLSFQSSSGFFSSSSKNSTVLVYQDVFKVIIQSEYLNFFLKSADRLSENLRSKSCGWFLFTLVCSLSCVYVCVCAGELGEI